MTIAYWLWFYMAFPKIQKKTVEDNFDNHLPVSIIISYKNAGESLDATIQSILQQDYPVFELIAINDFSTDDGFERIKKISDKRLIHLNCSKNIPGKKLALTEAIETSKYDVLLFTDADCLPASNNWITSMVKTYSEKPDTEIVLGYGPMKEHKGLLNSFIRYETLLTAMQYMTYAQSGIPYMGVGRNMLFSKSLYKKVKGYQNHLHIASGDDDLFVQLAANQENTRTNTDKKSYVYSEPKTNLKSYFLQKTRHISTSPHYKLHHQMLLGLFAGSQILFHITGFILILLFPAPLYVLGIFLIKWILQMMLSHRIFKQLDGSNLLRIFPLLDIFYTIYLITMSILSIKGQKDW